MGTPDPLPKINEFPGTPSSPSPSHRSRSAPLFLQSRGRSSSLPHARFSRSPRSQPFPSPFTPARSAPYLPLYILSTTQPNFSWRYFLILSIMAKLTLSLLLLLFLVAFSESRTPSDLPTDDVAFRDVTGTVAESTATILLPSEKPESEAATVALTDVETTATGSNAQEGADVPVADERPVLEPEKTTSVPLRTVTFRPYGLGGFHERTVPLSLRFPFRHGGRGCRHGHRGFRPRFSGHEIPFGNDMILSGERSGSDLESLGTERQMAGRWIRVHHRRPRFGSVDVAWKEDQDVMNRPDRREEREGHEEREHPHRHWKMDRDMMKRPHRPEEDEEDEEREHHHHRLHHHHFRHHHHDHEEEERHGGEGIFKRIRKFLNHF